MYGSHPPQSNSNSNQLELKPFEAHPPLVTNSMPAPLWSPLPAAVRAEPSDLYDLAGEANREHEALLGRQRLWQAQIAVVIRWV